MPVISLKGRQQNILVPDRIIVIGAGAHANVVYATLRHTSIGRIEFADPARVGAVVGDLPVVGDDDWVLAKKPAEVALVNAVGSTARPDVRAAVFEKFSSAGFTFATLVHPSAVVEKDVALDEGVQIMAGVVVQAGVTIGANTLVNTGATVDHDSTVSANCHIAPGVTICGGVRIGSTTHVGAGSTVIQSVEIGSRSVVGAGSLVTRNVPDNAAVGGCPAIPL